MGVGDVAQRVVRMGVAGETQQDLLVVRRDFGLAAEIGGSPPSEVGAGGDQGRRERDVTLRVPMGHEVDRKSVVSGKSVSVSVDLGGRRIIKKETTQHKQR